MENIDKLFAQRFNEQKPENNYNSGMWNDFEKQLEQEMPAAKTNKRKWWMGWRGLTLFNTILVGVVLFYNAELRMKNEELTAKELLITNYQLQKGSAKPETVETHASGLTSLKPESNKKISSFKSQVSSKESFVSTNQPQPFNFETHASSLTGLQLETTETHDSSLTGFKQEVVEVAKPETVQHATIETPNLTTHNSQLTTNTPQPTTKSSQPATHTPQLKKLKLPDWLELSSHPRKHHKKPFKKIPDIVPVPVEGF